MNDTPVTRSETGRHAATRMNLENPATQKKPDTQGHTLYGPIYMKCPESVNPLRQKADWWLPGTRGGGVGGEYGK